MRNLTVAAMLIIAMLLLYEFAFGGEEGIGRSMERRAERASLDIGSLDP